MKIYLYLLLPFLAFGCGYHPSQQLPASEEKVKVFRVDLTGYGQIYLFEYDGKTYIMPYRGGIIEHKALAENK